MTDAEQREAARQFVNRWMGKGKEDEDGRSYWIDLLTNVLGMDNVTERLNFEKKVVIDGNTKRIDVYIPETRVIIEQKSLGKALDQKIRNSGDVDLTPFEQADRYNGKLTFDERARWIVTSNFAEIWIYDMNQKQPEPTKIALDELQSKYPLLDFLVKKEVKTIGQKTKDSKSLKMTNNTGKKITVFETKSSSEESFSDNLLEDGDAVKNKEERTLYYTVKENDKLDVKVGLEDQDKTFVFKDIDTTDTKKVDVSLKGNKVNLDVTKKDGTTATLTPSEDSAKTEEEKKEEQTQKDKYSTAQEKRRKNS